MTTLKQTLEKFREDYKCQVDYKKAYKDILPDIIFEKSNHWFENWLTQSIKTALESVRNIELAPDEKTINDLEELKNKSQAFGYGQGFVCSRLDKNIEEYLK